MNGPETRRILETQLTSKELLTEVLSARRIQIPPRRFRVEKTVAGPSSLLVRRDAEAIQGQYGGDIVELVTPDMVHKGWPAVKDLGICRQCKAERKAPCTEVVADPDKPGATKTVIVAPHDVRLGKPGAIAEQRARDLPACPTCEVGAGAACRTRYRDKDGVERGRKCLPHPARLPNREKVPLADLGPCETCGTAAGQRCRTTNRRYKGHKDPNVPVPKVKTHVGRPRLVPPATPPAAAAEPEAIREAS